MAQVFRIQLPGGGAKVTGGGAKPPASGGHNSPGLGGTSSGGGYSTESRRGGSTGVGGDRGRVSSSGVVAGERGRLLHRKDIHQVEPGNMSLNCIRLVS